MLACALAACQATPQAPAPAPATPTRPATAATSQEVGDPCANRLHDLEAYLMLYVQARRQLPPTLETLRPLAGNKDLPLACPLSRRPYVYHPNGLSAEGDPRVLIAYDATPMHEGKRNAIMLMPATQNRAAFFDVIMVTDAVLKAFHAPDVR